jgi:hypothetical protein
MLESNTEQLMPLEADIYEKHLWEEWQEYPKNLPHVFGADLKVYDQRLNEMSTNIFCEDDSCTEISVIDIPGRKLSNHKPCY